MTIWRTLGRVVDRKDRLHRAHVEGRDKTSVSAEVSCFGAAKPQRRRVSASRPGGGEARATVLPHCEAKRLAATRIWMKATSISLAFEQSIDTFEWPLTAASTSEWIASARGVVRLPCQRQRVGRLELRHEKIPNAKNSLIDVGGW